MVRNALQTAAILFAVYELPVSAQEELGPKTIQALDGAVEAYQQGRLGDALRVVEPVLRSASAEQLQLADQRLHDEHRLEMSLVELASFCRVEVVLAGQGARLGRPPPAELPAALEALDDRIALLLEPVRREVELGMPAIIPDDVLTEKIDSIRPLLTQIDQAALLQSHIHQLASRIRAADRAQLDERPRDIARQKLADEQKKLEQLRDRVTTRLVEFSLVRLNNSLNTLGDNAASFQKRFTATQRAGESLATLHTNWERYKRAKQHGGGLDPYVEARWRRQEDLVRLQSGPLLEKVYHFDEGCRCWLRGRFGQGPLAGGLVKYVPAGMNQNEVTDGLLDSYLFMPRRVPKPQDPLSVADSYPIPRRFLEWWKVESRKSISIDQTVFSLRPEDRPGTIRRFAPPTFRRDSDPAVRARYTVDFEPVPESVRMARLVGYLEYQMALAHFEQLVRLCSPAEIRAIEEMVGDDDRFVVHSMLSSKYDGLDPGSTLRLSRRPIDPRATRANERRGLSWAMALARIELGAVRAGHTGESLADYRRLDYAQRNGKPELLADRASAFEKWPPTTFEQIAFLELLWDGARQLYYECTTMQLVGSPHDQFLTSLSSTRLRLLQLERKFTVAIEMLDAFQLYAGASLSPTQLQELERWRGELAGVLGRVQYALRPDVQRAFLSELPGLPETREKYEQFLRNQQAPAAKPATKEK